MRTHDHGFHQPNGLHGTCGYTESVVCTKPVARGVIPVWVRSAHEIFGAAAQPNGDKSPRHGETLWPQKSFWSLGTLWPQRSFWSLGNSLATEKFSGHWETLWPQRSFWSLGNSLATEKFLVTGKLSGHREVFWSLGNSLATEKFSGHWETLWPTGKLSGHWEACGSLVCHAV